MARRWWAGFMGVRLGAAFFGESMFHRARDCSKLALIHLVARLKAGGFTLLDTQFVTDHLRQFGAIEVPRKAYKSMLDRAIMREADFDIWPKDTTPRRRGCARSARCAARPTVIPFDPPSRRGFHSLGQNQFLSQFLGPGS